MKNLSSTITQEAIFIKSFKSVRLDGHTVKTTFAMLDDGIIQIQRQILSEKLNNGFEQIRKFGKYILQEERMVFKFESFYHISKTVMEYSSQLNVDNIVKNNDVFFNKNEVVKTIATNREMK